MLMGQGLRLALIGIVIGTSAAAILTRVLSSFSHLLYGVRATRSVDLCGRLALSHRAALSGLLYSSSPSGTVGPHDRPPS